MFTEEEKERAVELGKKLGIEVTFGHKQSGVYVGDKKVADIQDLFPELNTLGFTEEESEMHSSALKSVSTVRGKRFETL